MLKKETKRVVVTVELAIDEDGVAEIRSDFALGNGIGEYLESLLGLDVEVKKVIKVEEFE